MRWDRLGRVALLCVLAALLYLYLSAGVQLISTWSQSRHDKAAVSAMRGEHEALVRQRETLRRRGTVEAEARQLGMRHAGEQQYVLTGLPDD